MFTFTYTAAILALVTLGFAAFIFYEKRRDLLARYLAYHVFAVSIWVGFNALADVAFTDRMVIVTSGIALIGVSAFVSFYLCFIYAFIYKKRPGLLRQFLYFLPTVIFALGAFSSYSVQEVFILGNQPAQILPGVFYDYITVFLLGSLAYGFLQLLRYFRTKANPKERSQILYMEAGFVILFLGSFTFGYVLPFLGELRFFNVGPQFSIFLVGLSSYAILKHRLLDIKVVIQKGIIYTTLLMLIILFYVSVLYATLLFSDIFSTTSYLTASLITTFASIIGIPPLKRVFQKVTDSIFFRNRMPHAKALSELSRILNHRLDLKELIDETEKTLKKVLRLKEVHLVLVEKDAICLKPLPDHARVEEIEAKIPERLKTPVYACDQYDRLLKKFAKGHALKQAEMIIPVTLKDEMIALLTLGQKRSDEPFYENDVDLLKTFSYQCAVAIERAKLYEQVKKHSEELEEKVEERTAEIHNLREARVQMMLDISHNLQTPLTIIKGQLTSFRERPVTKANLQVFETSIDKISDFIQRLLKLANLTKLEEVTKADINLSEFLENIISYFRVLAEEQMIEIKADILRNLHVHGDKNQLEELILNLLSNSVKYIDDGRKIHIDLLSEGGMVKLIIKDTGIGIPKEELENLFSRFYRLSRDSQVPGTGLGLAICKRIIDLHDGDIQIESEVGKGTTVTVSLPQA